jgi:hypothetical protein
MVEWAHGYCALIFVDWLMLCGVHNHLTLLSTFSLSSIGSADKDAPGGESDDVEGVVVSASS